jgi:hypothetical protein
LIGGLTADDRTPHHSLLVTVIAWLLGRRPVAWLTVDRRARLLAHCVALERVCDPESLTTDDKHATGEARALSRIFGVL